MPSVQTKLAKYFTEILNRDYKTNISIDQATISVFGGVKFKKVMVRDYNNDTLFYINRLKTNILDYKKLINGDLNFGEIRIDGLVFNLKNYKGQKDNNLDKFIELFDDKSKKTSSKKFHLAAKDVFFTNSKFHFNDYNLEKPKILDFTKLNAHTNDFKILGPDVSTTILEMAFNDHRGLIVENLKSEFTYTKKNILLKKLDLKTPESKLIGDVGLYYQRKDFADFNNKVIFDVNVENASVSTNDLKLFYGEFAKNQRFDFSTKLKGTLNNFRTDKLKFVDNNKSEIVGDFNFKNLFSKEKETFYMKGIFSKISSTYSNLSAILPKVLGENLPSTFKKFGLFTLSGTTEVTLKTIKADVLLTTALGSAKSNLNMTNINNIDNATYVGNMKLNNFNLGKFLNRDDIGIVNLDLDVNGKGFKQKFLNTKLKGKIKNVNFNKYNFKNIVVDGIMKQSIFKGTIDTNDPNLQMNFDGILDISNKEKKYDFHAKVDYANLKKLNFYTKDSISVFRGDITMKVKGNTIDNLHGDIFINETSYENNKDTYFFDDFVVKSSFGENGLRSISINSPDIIKGKIEGKFQFNQLQKLIVNSIGSLYTNYKPNRVNKGQFIKFDFDVYNKFIEIFLPDISLGNNTHLKGSINSDTDDFKLNFKAQSVTAYKNVFDNINIEIDNKNPLFNTYIQLDSVKTKNYKFSDFSLINVTAKDTLFIRSEFKGGKNATDKYDLNLFHTINKDNKSVIGIKKSEVIFKDYSWFINELDSKANTVTFDKKLTDFTFDKIAVSHDKQLMEIMGEVRDSTYKDLKLSFKDVDLDKITPDIDSLKLKGKVNGDVNFKQKLSIYEPTSTLTIDSLSINKFDLGNLSLNVEGDNKFKNFKVKTVLKNNELEAFAAEGTIDIANKNTLLDLDLRLNNFNLQVLAPFGGEVIKNIRGFASGTARVNGNLDEPNVSGRLYLNQSGLKIPYLNVDYGFADNAIVDLTEDKFTFRRLNISDTKYGTQGTLSGKISHKKFSDWILDLNLDSKRLLALDTQDSDDALYYGTAFIDGDASIRGPISGLVISVNAKSETGTSIKIPINDKESTSQKDYIKFITTADIKNVDGKKTKTYNGIELKFDLEITPVAELEVIINKNTGHKLYGNGEGKLLMEINTLGKFNMWGDFKVNKGLYNFKYGGIVDKPFTVKKGGIISWEGDPLNAILNMEAVYVTEANPAVLLENPSFNKKIPTEVTIKLTDKLTNPIPEISIDFPKVSTVLKSELEYKLNDADTRQKQALFLLSTGNFLSEKGLDETAITGNLLETASSLFSDLFNDEDGKIKFGVTYQQSDKKNLQLQTESRFGVTISSQISDKISVNGKFGVPIGGVNESVIVGNVEVQLRITEDGALKARVFNRENDINYIGEGIGYTQGIGISYEVDFDNFKGLLDKIIKKKNKEKGKESNDQIPDSDLSPEFLQFTKERQKKKDEKPKPTKEILPETD